MATGAGNDLPCTRRAARSDTRTPSIAWFGRTAAWAQYLRDLRVRTAVKMRRHSLILAATIACVTALARADEPLMKLVRTIPLENVKGRIDHFGVDASAHRLYVAALGNDTVEVIDTAAGKRIHTIHGLKKPTGIRVLPESAKLVVASGDDGKVRLFDREWKLLGTVDGLDDADNVRLGPQGKLAYVGYGDGAIAIIDPNQVKKVAEIKLNGHPEAFQLEASGNRMFVNVPSAHHVAVLNLEKRAVELTWPIRDAEANFPMALDEANHRLFIGCRKPAKLLVLDTTTGKVVASIDCCGDTDDLFYDPASKRILLSCGDGHVAVIEQTDADHYRPPDNVPTAAGARTSTYIPETRQLYVAVPQQNGRSAEVRVYEQR